MSNTIIHFIRHGEVHNPHHILYGRMAHFRLNPTGQNQAQAVADYLKDEPIVAVYASPLLRARQTAQRIASSHKLEVQQTALLNEIHTPYQGKPYSYMESIEWRMYEDLEPPYETPTDLVKRIRKFCGQILRNSQGRTVVAVTHGDIVLHAQLWAKGLPLTYENRMSIQPYPATASISTLTFTSQIDLPKFSFHIPY